MFIWPKGRSWRGPEEAGQEGSSGFGAEVRGRGTGRRLRTRSQRTGPREGGCGLKEECGWLQQGVPGGRSSRVGGAELLSLILRSIPAFTTTSCPGAHEPGWEAGKRDNHCGSQCGGGREESRLPGQKLRLGAVHPNIGLGRGSKCVGGQLPGSGLQLSPQALPRPGMASLRDRLLSN